jgi:RNA polymerase sigma-70 factor (ECF subfamily)
MPEFNEQEIIERAKTNPAAFGELFEKYYKPILRYVLHKTGSAETAADITSETFFKALNKLHTYRFTGVPFSAWLYRIAGNEVNMFFRKRKYDPVLYDDAIGEEGVLDKESAEAIDHELTKAQEEIDKNKDYQDIKTALYAMDSKYQDVIVLRFFQEMTVPQIAEALGKNGGTVKSLLSRGLMMLRKKLEKSEK